METSPKILDYVIIGVAIIVGVIIIGSLAFNGLTGFATGIPITTTQQFSQTHQFNNGDVYQLTHYPISSLIVICKSPAGCINSTISQNQTIPLSHYNISYNSGMIQEKPI